MDQRVVDGSGAFLMPRTMCALFIVLIFGFAGAAEALVPYAHEGVAAIPIDGALVQARAHFNSGVSEQPAGVTVYVRFPLPGGGDGYLTMDLSVVGSGSQAPTRWTYYEKLSASVVSFDAESTEGTVTILDRFETGQETSLHIEFTVTFTEGQVTRRIERGFAVTAPSPAVLRSSGELPEGVVVVDDGSASTFVGAGASYHRGYVDCYGHPDDTVVIIEDDDDYYDDSYYEGQEDFVVADEDSDVSCDGSTDTDDDYYYEDSDEYDSGDSDSEPMCSDDDSDDTDEPGDDSGSDDDWYDSSDESSSDDSSGFDCVGDAEASTRLIPDSPITGPRYLRAGLRGVPPGTQARRLAARVVGVSPMLIALMLLLILRGRQSGTDGPVAGSGPPRA